MQMTFSLPRLNNINVNKSEINAWSYKNEKLLVGRANSTEFEGKQNSNLF